MLLLAGAGVVLSAEGKRSSLAKHQKALRRLAVEAVFLAQVVRDALVAVHPERKTICRGWRQMVVPTEYHPLGTRTGGMVTMP